MTGAPITLEELESVTARWAR